MKWRKLGLVYAPDGKQWWARSYACLPTVDFTPNGDLRVFFTSLDENRFGRIGYADVSVKDPTKVVRIGADPSLDLGELGSFDDCGVNPSCIVRTGDHARLYYIGWQRCQRTPYGLYAGLAWGDEQSNFVRASLAPVLDRSATEPILRSATSVICENGGFRAWYVSGLGWTTVNDRMYPTYVIRHARSTDGIRWDNSGELCIDFETPDEFGFGRPWVIKDPGVFRMWYSIRSRRAPYRIGYAESRDGLAWTRKDSEVGISRSDSGWDSEMICYSCVVDIFGKRYMFYNGNQHGSTGFGVAVLDEG